MIPAILNCILFALITITMLITFTGLLAYACAKASTRPYPTKPGTCTHENKDLT